MKNDFEFYTVDVENLWKCQSSFAIVEDVEKYLVELDKKLESLPKDAVMMLIGKSPIWFYGIVVCRILQKRPDIHMFYSKPTNMGHRKYKIYPY